MIQFFAKGPNVSESLQKMVRGAHCAECRQRLGDNPIFYNEDTTQRTVHWRCRTQADDPGIENAN